LYAQKHEEGQAAEMFEKFFASQEGHDHYQLEHVNYLAELYEANVLPFFFPAISYIFDFYVLRVSTTRRLL